MGYINGGLVIGMSWHEERAFISRKNRHLLLQHRAKKYHYLVDWLIPHCSELQELLDVIRLNGSEHGVKGVKGRIIGFMMIRYIDYFLYPQRYAHKGDLIFYANYFLIQQHLFAVVGKLKHLGQIPKDKYFKFRVKTDTLYKLSQLFYDELQEVVTKKLVPHYKKLHKLD